MTLLHHLQLEQLQLYPQGSGVCLLGLLTILLAVHFRTHTVIGQDGCSNSSQKFFCRVEVRTVKFILTRHSHSRFNGRCFVHWYSVLLSCSKRMELQTVLTKLISWNCPECFGMLEHSSGGSSFNWN